MHEEDLFVYQRPPESMRRILDAPLFPAVSSDPARERLLLLDRQLWLRIEDLATPELGLAGIRFHPALHAPSRRLHYCGMRLLETGDGRTRSVRGLPDGARIANPAWSPDSRFLAFTLTVERGVELWILNAETARVRRLYGPGISDLVMRTPYRWLPDSRGLLVRTLPDRHGAPPPRSRPRGPIVQESHGEASPARTYQDLLRSPDDERLFEHHFACQIREIRLDGSRRRVGPVRILRRFSLSPDGRYILTVSMERPWSYLVPYHRFGHRVEIWERETGQILPLHRLPPAEAIPLGFDAVATGPRSHEWRADVPATLVWVEALDGGDPSREAAWRDRIWSVKLPATDCPVKVGDLSFRYAGIHWGREDLAFVTERWWKSRRVVVSSFNPSRPGQAGRVYSDRSLEDWYRDPGTFLTCRNASGHEVLRFTDDGTGVYLSGDGATPEGNRPFLDRLELKSGRITRLFRSEAPYYEVPLVLGNAAEGLLLTTRESNTDNPNLFLRNLSTGHLQALTNFPHPWPELAQVRQELVHYRRADGLPLTARLYLPAGWRREDGYLPAILWAYPEEYKSRANAGQVRESPYTFPRIGRDSPLLWVAAGFAFMGNVGMPVVGEAGEEPNDTYVEQLVMNARAAIDLLKELGVSDGRRLSVGGHSYGAFMAVNLAAHSRLFAAVIARSGAYNRSLTPFGFQAEERSYWEARETYHRISPFTHADAIETPVLLIHGAADENPGTHPLQSERLYQALRGLGKRARLVMLPAEGHGYRARESVEHVLWETHEWLKRWLV